MGQQREFNDYGKQLVALGRVLQTLREEENVDVLIETTLNYLQSEFDYQLIWIGLYDRLDHRLLGKGGISPDGDVSLLRHRFSLNPGDILEQVVIEQRPVGVPDLREERRAGEWRKAAQQYNIQGTIVFPIRYKDRCFGVALLGSRLWGISPASEEKARLSIILGGLGAALFQIELEWQRQQAKRPEQPLLSLISKLRSGSNLDRCLEAVVEETHSFLEAERTNVYWFEPARRYFWRRLSNRPKTTSLNESNQPASGITVSEIGGFYQALLSDQVVSIGEAHSSLKAEITGRLMQHLRARSLLAAPILYQNELLGFLAVEGSEPRIWREEEKNYIRGAAQLVTLTVPVAEMEAAIAQIKADQELTSAVTRAIYTDEDWNTTLKKTAEYLCDRLNVQRVLILTYNPDHFSFDIAHQTQPTQRRAIATAFSTLSAVDTEMLTTGTEAVAIENWAEDYKLIAWRETLFDVGVRSLLLSSTNPGKPLEGVLAVACETPRSWSHSEAELLTSVAAQLGLILHQWHLQRQNDAMSHLMAGLQSHLWSLEQNVSLERVEVGSLQHIASALQVPLVALVTWPIGATTDAVECSILSVELSSALTYPANFKTQRSETIIPLKSDPLIQSALATPDVVGPMRVSDIPPVSQQWLTLDNEASTLSRERWLSYAEASGSWKIVVVGLHTAPLHEVTGVLLIVSEPSQPWSIPHQQSLSLFAKGLAWSRRHTALVEKLSIQREELQRFNWYKHRRLEDLYRVIGGGLKSLNELGEAATSGKTVPLQSMRFGQILRQLGNALSSISPLLKTEQWQLAIADEIIPLASLLRRSLERVDPLLKQRRIWSQVHSEGHRNICGDMVKLELVVYELLVAACRRCQPGGRIDIWCRSLEGNPITPHPLDGKDISGISSPSFHRLNFLEVAITDTGTIDPNLLAELQARSRPDLLMPSLVSQPPGLFLVMCQSFVQQMGGELNFYQLEDGRLVSQLLLRLQS